MMIISVPGGGGGGKKKGRGGSKQGKKGGKGQGGRGEDVQVNLIVNPHTFNFKPDHDGKDNISESDNDDSGMPGSFSFPKSCSKGRGRRKHRCRILARLAMKQSWHHVWEWAKKLAVIDMAGIVL